MWVITARSAHCLRCTNCSRRFCTEEYTQRSTRNKQNIKLASENPTRQQTTLQLTEWLSRNATSGESKCGQRQSTSRKHLTPLLTYQSGKPAKFATSNTSTSASWRRYTETKKASVQTDEERNIFEIRKRHQSRWTAVKLVVQHCSSPLTEGRYSTIVKEKRMGIYLYDNDHDCLTNLRFADDVLLLAFPKNRYRTCCMNSRIVLKKWDLRFIQKRRKFSGTRASLTRTQKRTRNWRHEILTRSESVKYLGQKISFHHQETTEINYRIRAAWATCRKYR